MQVQARCSSLEADIAHLKREVSEELAHREACERRMNMTSDQVPKEALRVASQIAQEKESSLRAALGKLQTEHKRLKRASAQLEEKVYASYNARFEARAASRPSPQAAAPHSARAASQPAASSAQGRNRAFNAWPTRPPVSLPF